MNAWDRLLRRSATTVTLAVSTVVLLVLLAGVRALDRMREQQHLVVDVAPRLEGTGSTKLRPRAPRDATARKDVNSRSLTAHQHDAFAAPPVDGDADDPVRASAVDAEAVLALVIDDLGHSLTTSAKGVLALPVPVTVAVLPGRALSHAIAEMAHDRGHGVIVHLPMEPEGMRDDVPDLILSAGMSDSARQVLLDAAAAIPHAEGLSNHQGSRATQDAALMDELVAWAGARDWYVLDSITHPASLLYERAVAAGVPALQRRVFLDHEPDSASVHDALLHAVDIARRTHRPVVAVGHPRAATVAVLQAQAPALREQGVRFVRLNDIIPSTPTTPGETR